jgi:hypothetical protein
MGVGGSDGGIIGVSGETQKFPVATEAFAIPAANFSET